MRPKPNSAPGDSHADETRRQLLEAAGEVFAEVGFRDATVREICKRAGANIAAVNYHFGDKETLYAEVFRYAQARALERHPVLLDVKPDAPPEKKLRAFVHSLLLRIFDEGPAAWYGKLMSREMIEPTAALDAMVQEKIRPMSGQWEKIVREILGAGASPETIKLCGLSVVSQCVFYHHCGAIVLRLDPKMQLDAPMLERLAEHITQFSLAALKQFRKDKKKSNEKK